MDTYTGYGLYYGYPHCCIDAFIIRAGIILVTGCPPELVDHLVEPFEVDGTATGYMMCPRCAKLPREQLVERINLARDPALPAFPPCVT